jgi:hypothetical protein
MHITAFKFSKISCSAKILPVKRQREWERKGGKRGGKEGKRGRG